MGQINSSNPALNTHPALPLNLNTVSGWATSRSYDPNNPQDRLNVKIYKFERKTSNYTIHGNYLYKNLFTGATFASWHKPTNEKDAL